MVAYGTSMVFAGSWTGFLLILGAVVYFLRNRTVASSRLLLDWRPGRVAWTALGALGILLGFAQIVMGSSAYPLLVSLFVAGFCFTILSIQVMRVS
jgi:hypothetical protein